MCDDAPVIARLAGRLGSARLSGRLSSGRHARLRRAGGTALVLTALLATGPSLSGRGGNDDANDVVVKAAFLLNFVKFTTWPAIKSDARLSMCVVGDEPLIMTLADTVRGQSAGDHPIEVRRAPDRSTWPSCQVLYVGDGETRHATEAVSGVRTAPVLTVSDVGGFAHAGIIELYVEGRRMRFAINVDAAGRSGLHLSSRLLALARIVRDDRTQ